jgi:hypothetical protein
LRPVLLLPDELFPEDLLPDDLLPEDLLFEDLVELLLGVLLTVDLDELLLFFTPLSLEELLLVLLLFVLLLFDLPVVLFPDCLCERADEPERVDVLLLVEDDLLRSVVASLRVRARFSSRDPVLVRPVFRWFVDLVPADPRS